LLYVKAGAAWARDNYRLPETVASVGETNETRAGFDVGGGLEWIVAPDWSMSVEYNYAGFNAFSWHPGSASFDVRQDLQTLLVGLNYRFGGH
jgi:outer membrane immunogenic protein